MPHQGCILSSIEHCQRDEGSFISWMRRRLEFSAHVSTRSSLRSLYSTCSASWSHRIQYSPLYFPYICNVKQVLRQSTTLTKSTDDNDNANDNDFLCDCDDYDESDIDCDNDRLTSTTAITIRRRGRKKRACRKLETITCNVKLWHVEVFFYQREEASRIADGNWVMRVNTHLRSTDLQMGWLPTCEVVMCEVLIGEVLTCEVLTGEVLTGDFFPCEVLTDDFLADDFLTGEGSRRGLWVGAGQFAFTMVSM